MSTTDIIGSKKSSEKVKLDFKESKYATGRRKQSVARVWVKKGSGKIFVNGKEMNHYFKRQVNQISLIRCKIKILQKYQEYCFKHIKLLVRKKQKAINQGSK